MIGSALKKLAKEYDMTVDKGIAYGSLGGFAATLSEGPGSSKSSFPLTLTTLPAEPASWTRWAPGM